MEKRFKMPELDKDIICFRDYVCNFKNGLSSQDEFNMAIERFTKWVRSNNIKKYLGKKNLAKMVVPSHYDCYDEDTFFDHRDMFETEYKQRIFIIQPYVDINDTRIKKAKKIIKEKGLKITKVSKDSSWHLPGETILVQIELDNINVFRDFMRTSHDETYLIPLPFKFDKL